MDRTQKGAITGLSKSTPSGLWVILRIYSMRGLPRSSGWRKTRSGDRHAVLVFPWTSLGSGWDGNHFMAMTPILITSELTSPAGAGLVSRAQLNGVLQYVPVHGPLVVDEKAPGVGQALSKRQTSTKRCVRDIIKISHQFVYFRVLWRRKIPSWSSKPQLLTSQSPKRPTAGLDCQTLT